MKSIDLNSASVSELMLLMSCRLLLITKHSTEFVEQQKRLISSMALSEGTKKACLDTLDSIETEVSK